MTVGRERAEDGRRRNGTVGAPQVALAVLVAGGAALGALLLHPGTGLLGKGRGPLGGNPLLVIGLAVLGLLAGLVLRDAYLGQVGVGRELGPMEQRLVDTVSRVLMIAPVAVPVLLLALHRFGAGGGDPGSGTTRVHFPARDQQGVPTPKPPPPQHHDHHEHGIHLGLMRILLGLGITLLVVAVVCAGILLWRHLTRPAESASGTASAALDDEQDRLAQAVDSGRRALLDGDDARTAVIACYAAMEDSLAESGVARRASDSPQDLLERAVAGGLPVEAAAAELTALFREARYSTHPMDDGHRDRAAAALAEIAEVADGLRARGSGAGAGAEAGAGAGAGAVAGTS